MENGFDSYISEGMEELNELLNEYDVILPDGLQRTDLGNVRRPLVLFRGKPITREETIQLITGEEPLFFENSDERSKWYSRGERGVLKNIFYRQGYSWLSTWVYTDGTIGGNLISLDKYPEIFEIIPDYIHLAGKYPFLDMVISYTLYNECCCFLCDGFGGKDAKKYREQCTCRDCEKYIIKLEEYDRWKDGFSFVKKEKQKFDFEREYFQSWGTSHIRSDVAEQVELTIWIHNGKTEILFGDKAKNKFMEYNTLYSSPEYEFMFSSDLYQYDKTCICDRKFVEDCFEYMGRPRNFVEKCIACNSISPFHEPAIVVTRQWVTEQYNQYIAIDK